MLLLFAGLLGATVYMLQVTPRGFIPPMDQGYAIVVIQLPQGSSLSRTDAVTREASEIIQATPGASDAVAFAGLSGATIPQIGRESGRERVVPLCVDFGGSRKIKKKKN